jgi:hypothetical protein
MSGAQGTTTTKEKPQLAGTQIKTRKRNIAVPLDPGSFADAVVQIFQDSKDGDDVEKNLQAAVKVLESADLDFSRYGETLFEVIFAGGRLAAGGSVVSQKENKRLEFNVLNAEADRPHIEPYIKICQQLVRRRPFLIKALEATLSKLMKSLDFYGPEERQKLAIATSRVFALKVGVLPDRVLLALLNDRIIAKGSVLEFVTFLFKDFLATENMDDLVVLLRKARLDDKLLDLFPPQKRNLADFESHFKAEGLDKLVEHNAKKVQERQLEELKVHLTEMLTSDPPAELPELLEAAKEKKTEYKLPDAELIKALWSVLLATVNMVGKNGQQILATFLKQIKAYKKLFTEFATSAKAETALINHIQVTCYEDSKLQKLFAQIVRILYDADIVGEDAIVFWYKKGSVAKGRNVFVKDMEPFIKWLEEAEEEEDDE